jgi:phage terminase small subunit
MNVIDINKGTDLLSQVPKPPVYLTDEAKEHYKEMGKILCSSKRMKETFLPALQVFAEYMAQFEFACRKIKEENKKEFGKGYVQTFSSGAKNVSVYVSLRNDAAGELLKCFKIFGMDPKSEKEMKPVDPAQTSLFDELMKMKNG